MKRLLILLLVATGLFAQSESGGYYIPSKWKLSGTTISPANSWNMNLGGATGLFWNETNKRLGIGTTAPSLTATIKSDGTFGWDNGSGTGDVILNRDAANILAMKNGVNNQLFRLYDEDNTGSNDRYLELGWLTDSSAVLRQAISGTKTSRPLNFTTFSSYSFDNNLGVGVTSAVAPLEINKNIANTATIARFVDASMPDGDAFLFSIGQAVSANTGYHIAYQHSSVSSSRKLIIGTMESWNTTENLVINGDGNVGIATTNPLAKLHTNGTAMFGAGTGASLTDSSLVVNYSTGSPVLNWYGTDGDTWNIGINTDDGATFNGATTYNFDNVVVNNAPVTLKGYTVATLPAGTVGMTAYVTDATAPTYLGTLTGGGAVVTPVFYNGTAWVSY